MNGNDRVAAFIRDITWDALPADVQARAKLCLLDGLGATLGGTLAPISRVAGGYAAESWRGDAATIFQHSAASGLFGRRASPAGAAFANACAGNALDIDDDAIFTRGHPGAQLIPATLAVAEALGASGKAVLEALVVGYEVAIRAGRCWHAHHEIYQACGSWGSVGCAAAAARLLGLEGEQIKHALGIAEYHAPNAPMLRDITAPSMAKHAIGWGALNGVTSAELAARGYTGIPSILGFEVYQDWVLDIGETYWMADWVFYKEWCSCAWGHPACVAALGLVQGNGIEVDQIAHLRVRGFEETLLLHQDLPTTTEQAQFSVKWPLACLLLDGKIGPDQILAHRFGDARVRALFDKIELALDPEIETLYKAAQEMDLRMHGRVEITLTDGRHFDSGIVERGADRYTAAELENKFRWLVGHVLPPDQVEKLLTPLREFEHVRHVRDLIGQISKGNQS